jgi:dipeptidyl aminopeptidase/acylaminoacyl peptidase
MRTKTICATLGLGLLVVGCHESRERSATADVTSPSTPTQPKPNQPPTSLPAVTVAASVAPPSAHLPVSPYVEAHAKFQTHLVRKEPAPQRYRPISPPPGTLEVPYSSGGLKLNAWVSAPPAQGQRRSAVLFLHGGFAFAEDDWEMTKPYRDAGFVVFAPMLRGENGLPGNYSMFFDELDDVLAAAAALAALPYVRADHLYVAGHSVGGTLTMLAAMSSGRFRAAAAFSGSPDQISWSAGQPELVPFDSNDVGEFRIRSPIAYATSFQCPARLYHGSVERYFAAPTAKLAELAQGAGLDVRAVPVAGDHMSHVAEAMRQSIEFFRERE